MPLSLSSLWRSVLTWCGVVPRKTRFKVTMLGLDSAGKTTLLYNLAALDANNRQKRNPIQDLLPHRHCPVNDYYTKRIETVIPTIGFNVETLKLNSSSCYHPLEVICWDVGGPDRVRPLWRYYLEDTDGLVFVIDSSDTERFDSAAEELVRCANDMPQPRTPILILANKWDLGRREEGGEEDMLSSTQHEHNYRDRLRRGSLEELKDRLMLHRLEHPWKLLPAVADASKTGGEKSLETVLEGIRWMTSPGTRKLDLLQYAEHYDTYHWQPKLKKRLDPMVVKTGDRLPKEIVHMVAAYLDWEGS